MPSVYEYATQWSEKDLKKEYTRLRDQFQKQIGRLAEKDQSARVKAFLPSGYKYQKTIKEIENLRGRKGWSEKSRREDWARRIAELRELRSARSLSISGRKKIRQRSTGHQGRTIKQSLLLKARYRLLPLPEVPGPLLHRYSECTLHFASLF